MPVTTGMKGGGFYDRHSAAQQSAIEALRGWVDDAVAKLPLPDAAQPLTVLDLGSSEGRNAVYLMETVVSGLRQRTKQPVRTIFSDLPSNNFNKLFSNLQEVRQAGRLAAEVYPSAVGGSFYNPLLPPGTVHLATCFNSILWLDRLPQAPLHNRVVYRRPHPPKPGHSVSAEVVTTFSRQAEDDLVRFLECRARELVGGGKLLLATPGDTENACVADGIYDLLNDACLDLLAAGRLQQQQYERVTMPLYFRTLPELLAPLEREGSPVHGAFTVDRAESMEVETPFDAEFVRSGNASAFAEAYTGFLRAFSEPVVRSALQQPEKGVEIVQSLYERVHARLLAEPERYRFRYALVAALLTRRPDKVG